MREHDLPSDATLGPEVEAALKALALAEPSARFTQDVLGRLDRPAPRGFPLAWRPALAAASALIVLATGWWILADRRAVNPASGVPAAVSSPAAGPNAPSSRDAVAGPGAGRPAAGATAQVARRAGRDAGPHGLAGRAPVDSSTEWAGEAARGAEDALVIAPIDPLGDIVLDAVAIMEIDLGPLDVPPLMLPSIDEIDDPVQSPGR